MTYTLSENLKALIAHSELWKKDKIFLKSTPENKDGVCVIDITGGRGANVLSTFSPLNYYERIFQIRSYDTNIRAQDTNLELLETFLTNFYGDFQNIRIHRIELISGPHNLGQELNGLQSQSMNFKLYYSKITEEV